MAYSTPSKGNVADITARHLIDSKRLLYFFQVARLGSLTQAEAVLSVAQSAISRQIQQLESEIGQQLLQRNGRGVTLTEAGTLLYKQAEVILQEMTSTMDLLAHLKDHPSGGRVALASPPIFANMYLPAAVQQFIERYPDVRLDVYEASTGLVYEYLASGQVDMAIVLQATSSQRMVLQKLVTQPLLLMVGRSHPLARRKSVKREELGDLELTMPSSMHGSRALLEAYCEEGGVHLAPRLRLDSLAMTTTVVAGGRLCAVLPREACTSEIERKDIAAIALDPPLKRTVYLAHLRDRAPTPHMKALAREIAHVVRAKISAR